MRWILALLFSGFVVTAQAQEQETPSFDQADFDAWVTGVRSEALEKGISAQTLDQALATVRYIPRIIELDRRQPEFTITAARYIETRVSETRIKRGREKIDIHGPELKRIADSYGVSWQVIAAIWGIETNYGATMGGFELVSALSTLAYDPRRSSFFREQLFKVLQILDEGHITADKALGSWAGAMGQSQFMPNSYLAYARDGNGDGRVDIWETEADVFASIANYLAKAGWKPGWRWGREVRVPVGFDKTYAELMTGEKPRGCRAMKYHTRPLPLSEWAALGLRLPDGNALPIADLRASLVAPDGLEGPTYLAYPNYKAILAYNCSNLYGMAVGKLSEYMY